MHKNNLSALLFALLLSFTAQAQKQLFVAFYNQEILFDTIDDPDKNDNEFLPTDESIKKVSKAKGHATELAPNDPFNAMYALKEQKLGSHYYKNEWSTLDQIIMSNNIVNCTGMVCYKDESAAIYKQDWMIEQEGKHKGYPLRTFGGQKYLSGYSDHLSVSVILEIRNNLKPGPNRKQ